MYIYIQVAWCHSWSCTAAKNHFLQQLWGGSQSSGSPQRREEVSSPLRACHASQILWQVQPTKKNKWGWPKTETDKERERDIYIYINRLLKTCSKLNQHRSMWLTKYRAIPNKRPQLGIACDWVYIYIYRGSLMPLHMKKHTRPPLHITIEILHLKVREQGSPVGQRASCRISWQ